MAQMNEYFLKEWKICICKDLCGCFVILKVRPNDFKYLFSQCALGINIKIILLYINSSVQWKLTYEVKQLELFNLDPISLLEAFGKSSGKSFGTLVLGRLALFWSLKPNASVVRVNQMVC